MSSEAEVANGILNRIQEVMNDFACAECVFLMDLDRTEISIQATTVAVMIRDGSQVHPLSGAGLTRSLVGVCLTWRNLTDRQPRATNRIAGPRGILDVLTALREALNGSFLGEGSAALLTTPMLLVTYGSPEQVDGKPGWVRATDVYEYGRAFPWTETGE